MSSINDLVKIAFEKTIVFQLRKFLEFALRDKDEDEDEDIPSFLITKFYKDNLPKFVDMRYVEEEDSIGVVMVHRHSDEENDIIFEIKKFSSLDKETYPLIAKEIVRLTKEYNTNNLCLCNKPLNFNSDLLNIHTNNNIFITNQCEDCASSSLMKINKWVDKGLDVSELNCDVCFVNFLEKNENGFKYNENYDITCCKDKVICKSCQIKCKKKCPFCRQELKYDY